MTADLIPVEVDCPCPGRPHPDGDTVYLDPELSALAGLAISVALNDIEDAPQAIRVATAYEMAANAGIRDWTLVDDKAEKLPLKGEPLRRLPFNKGGAEIINKAVTLYSKAISAPFRKPSAGTTQNGTSLPTGLTESSSTSPVPVTSRRRRKH